MYNPWNANFKINILSLLLDENFFTKKKNTTLVEQKYLEIHAYLQTQLL